jgi:hypothetical protein
MCKRDELKRTIDIVGEPGCDPSNAAKILRNINRMIAESGPELSEEDKAALATAKDSAKQAALANYQELLAGI